MIKTLADRLAEVTAKTVRDTLGHVENYSLVEKFAATLAEMKAKTIDGTLRDVQAGAMHHSLAPVWRPRHPSEEKLTVLQEWRLTQLL